MDDRVQQPNSRDCFVCGVENPIGLNLTFYSVGSGMVEAEYIVPNVYQGYPGVVHGGIIAAMLDEITYRSIITDNPNRMMFTARLNIRYRMNVPVEEKLKLIGIAGSVKSRTATAKGMIYDNEGKLLAEAEAILITVPDYSLDEGELEALGWKVYD